MLSTLAFQLAAFQLASAQLAAFQLASAQLASAQLACDQEALVETNAFQLAASNAREPVIESRLTNWFRPTFGFGGVSIIAAPPASIAPTPPSPPAALGR